MARPKLPVGPPSRVFVSLRAAVDRIANTIRSSYANCIASLPLSGSLLGFCSGAHECDPSTSASSPSPSSTCKARSHRDSSSITPHRHRPRGGRLASHLGSDSKQQLACVRCVRLKNATAPRSRSDGCGPRNGRQRGLRRWPVGGG